jgi:hypothetical protein
MLSVVSESGVRRNAFLRKLRAVAFHTTKTRTGHSRADYRSAFQQFRTHFKRASLARGFLHSVTCNWKPIASKTPKTVLKFGCFAPPAKAR